MLPENVAWHPCSAGVLDILLRADVTDCKLFPSGSNYVFLISLSDAAAGNGFGVYKPRRGEAPLWDFPDGTLYRRERAAYLLAQDLGWDFIPPTVIREGPYGIGSVQLFIDNDSDANFFTLRDDYADEMRRIALFDAIANNADRKGGHCLLGPDGKVWGIDHGLTFHESNKLRTVIWDYSEEPIAPALLNDLAGLAERLSGRASVFAALAELLHPAEIASLQGRIEDLLQHPVYPNPGMRRSVPWPPV
ncbi:MAG TPA: SCO1664 family protein [Dehalococcoidia bacterium]|nr:SCO1664 family protein [Dehalococcoidia bacterium]